MNITLFVTKREFFDVVSFCGSEKALEMLWSVEDAYENVKVVVKFDDGSIFQTKDELRIYIQERKNEIFNNIQQSVKS